MFFGAAPRTNAKKTCFSKDIEERAQNMIPILGSRANIFGGGLYDYLEHESFHFDDE